MGNDTVTYPDEKALRWISHVKRQEASITKTAVHWTPEGERRRGRTQITRWRTVKKEMKKMGTIWSGIQVIAMDQQKRKDYIAALHAIKA